MTPAQLGTVLFPLLLLLLLPGPSVPLLQVDPPSVILHSSSTLRTSTEATFSCLEVQPDNSLRRPSTQVLWFKDGEILDVTPKKYRLYGKKKRLRIKNPSEIDAGVYECAFSPDSVDRGRAELWIQPRVTYAPSPQVLLAAANQIIVCQVSGGVRGVEWTKGDDVISWTSTNRSSWSSDPHFTPMADGSLQLSQATLEDSGVYQCSVHNRAGRQSVEIVVTVRDEGGPESEYVVPLPPTERLPISSTPTATTAVDTPRTTPVAEDTCLELLDASFLPSVETPPGRFTTELPPQPDPNRLPISWTLIVPTFTTTPPDCVRTTVGYSIVIKCSAEGTPTPQIIWRKSDRNIAVQGEESFDAYGAVPHYQVLGDGSLKINTVQRTDRAVYTCTARNLIAYITESVRLKVTLEEDICGVSPSLSNSPRVRRIVDGEKVHSPEEFPWQVLIEYVDHQPTEERLCGGALVRPDWVVTAAHCLYSHPNWLDPSDLRVRVGVVNRTWVEPAQQELEVSHIFIHPNYTHPYYSTTGLEYDIALLKLRHPARLTRNVGIACIPQRSQDPPVGTTCLVSGWGHWQYGDSSSPESLHKASVPIVSYSKCRSQESYSNAITRNILCAGHEHGGEDACQNDSGGPLVCQINGRWTLYGVVNYGEGCGAPHKYGLYARVTRFFRWMNTVMEHY